MDSVTDDNDVNKNDDGDSSDNDNNDSNVAQQQPSGNSTRKRVYSQVNNETDKTTDEDTKWKADVLLPDDPLLPSVFAWHPLKVNPAEKCYTACDLLVTDTFIDKSEVVLQFLEDSYISPKNDFSSVTFLVVYPRRFAKSTLLGFIEAVFSPLPEICGYKFNLVKEKVAALKHGPELLKFGLHPVLRLNMLEVADTDDLHRHIRRQLEKAGLDQKQISSIFSNTSNAYSPVNRLHAGAKMLNEKFEQDTHKATKTILLIDEYDKPFRETKLDHDLIKKMLEIYSLGKWDNTSISLLVLCGRTRMVGTQLNNLVDVSVQTKHHGLCGISVKELVECNVNGQLDDLAKKQYKGQTFQEILINEFAPKMSGFRFGLTQKKGKVDPDLPEGSLFSPLDVWEVISSLETEDDKPFSRWIANIEDEFEFRCFCKKYKDELERGRQLKLFRSLNGGHLSCNNFNFRMKRDDYLELKEPLRVIKVLWELGLLGVKYFADGVPCLAFRNYLVTRAAMVLLVKEARPGVTPLPLAEKYLSKDGLDDIAFRAARQVTTMYCKTGPNIPHEYVLQDWLYMELLYRFPENTNSYTLYKKVYLPRMGETNKDFLDVAVALHYKKDGLSQVYLIEVKCAACTPPKNVLANDYCVVVNAAHEKNLKAATKQVQKFIWDKQECVEQRVVVSGVWHPKTGDEGTHEMSCKCKFVETS